MSDWSRGVIGFIVAYSLGAALAGSMVYLSMAYHVGCEPQHLEHKAAPGETIDSWACPEGLGYAAPFVGLSLVLGTILFAGLVLASRSNGGRNRG